jgi:formamidopyrimidine-DNA glycosylase
MPGARIAAVNVERASIVLPQTAGEVEMRLRGRRIERVRRRAKQVLIETSGGWTIRVHLGMTGNLYVVEDDRFRPVTTRAWLKLSGERALIFDDARALGHLNVYDSTELGAVLANVGVEPLSKRCTPELLREVASGSRLPVKLFLMDQSKIAGLGNIYAAESLFRARIHPARIAGKLPARRFVRLHEAIVRVLTDAIQSACIAYMRPGRFREGEAFAAQVYGREGEPCLQCRRKVRRIQQGGRSTYFCPGCQT